MGPRLLMECPIVEVGPILAFILCLGAALSTIMLASWGCLPLRGKHLQRYDHAFLYGPQLTASLQPVLHDDQYIYCPFDAQGQQRGHPRCELSPCGC